MPDELPPPVQRRASLESDSEAPVALVTGGGGGIGAATCALFVARGWRVVVADVDPKAVEEVVATLLPGSATAIICDVRDTDSVTASLSEIRAVLGRLDAVVNNAGIFRPSPSHLVSDESFNELLDVHLGGTVRVSRAALPLLVESVAPAIVNISSITAARGFPGRLSYNAAKAAIEAVTRTLAVEWGVSGVRVNAVAPGFIMTEHMIRQYERGVADVTTRASRTALGRMGRPEEAAETIYWLCSPASSYVTGHVLAVDGGFLAYGATGPDPAFFDDDRLRASLNK